MLKPFAASAGWPATLSGGGSHYKVSHPSRWDIVTVPANRPIKPFYIKKLVAFLDGVAKKA